MEKKNYSPSCEEKKLINEFSARGPLPDHGPPLSLLSDCGQSLIQPVLQVMFPLASNMSNARGGGGSSPIFLRGCAISGFETPPFDKARQRRKFDPYVR